MIIKTRWWDKKILIFNYSILYWLKAFNIYHIIPFAKFNIYTVGNFRCHCKFEDKMFSNLETRNILKYNYIEKYYSLQIEPVKKSYFNSSFFSLCRSTFKRLQPKQLLNPWQMYHQHDYNTSVLWYKLQNKSPIK